MKVIKMLSLQNSINAEYWAFRNKVINGFSFYRIFDAAKVFYDGQNVVKVFYHQKISSTHTLYQFQKG